MTKLLPSEESQLKQRIYSVILKERKNKIVGSNYLKRISQNRIDIEKRLLKLSIFNIILVFSLFFYVFGGVGEFAFFGNSIAYSPNVREFLFLTVVAIFIFESFVANGIVELEFLEDTIIEEICDDVSEQILMKASLPCLWLARGNLDELAGDDKINYSRIGVLLTKTPRFFQKILLIVVIAMYAGILMSVWLQILWTPNFSWPWTIVILIFSAIAVVNCLAFQISRHFQLHVWITHKTE